MTGDVVAANAEAIEAWDGVLFDRFVKYRHALVTGLAAHGNEAQRLHPPAPGDHVVDVGCGFGDSAQELAALVGPTGAVVGIDAAPRFIEVAAGEAAAAGVENLSFAVADVEAGPLEGPFDYAFSRFGTMFFANPVNALRNVRAGLVPGGRLVMVVWRSKPENEWVQRALDVVERFARKPDEYEEPTCGPGPFSMANADTTSGILKSAGFTDISLRRNDGPLLMGTDLEEAVDMVLAIGPAGEIVRLQGDRIAHLLPDIRAAVTEELSSLRQPDGTVVSGSSVWIVSATNPG
jgi:SAM-dependent methyltransferase